ncbi:hypothetical protein EYF80_006595 [Liparis tanakae]|uniref:Uncharacterized protein n=1 Tax=Liparis tanakae TaxID=230148 RepID=A0A4Z2IZX7_9TELE|nr:hypothetical protein EYF80_006595 [Liparis tanakae]
MDSQPVWGPSGASGRRRWTCIELKDLFRASAELHNQGECRLASFEFSAVGWRRTSLVPAVTLRRHAEGSRSAGVRPACRAALVLNFSICESLRRIASSAVEGIFIKRRHDSDARPEAKEVAAVGG